MSDNIISKVIKIVYGLILFGLGLNLFFGFKAPPEFSVAGSAFTEAVFNTGYIFPLIALIFVLAGILIVMNKAVPLTQVLILPISVNFLLFHIFVDMTGLLFGLIVSIPNIYLLIVNKDSYKNLLK